MKRGHAPHLNVEAPTGRPEAEKAYSATPPFSGPLLSRYESDIRALVDHYPNRNRPVTDLHPACTDIWNGSKSALGQGSFSKDGFSVDAGEAIWILANGPLPRSKTVARRCEHPPCVTLAHLYPVPKVMKS